MRILILALCACALTRAAVAAIIVNPAQAIDRRVTVQLIQTALDSGSTAATVFGNATQRANIEQSIDMIWAQAGIDIQFLPTITRYNDTFAYQGNNGSGTRNSNDLGAIFSNARNEGGILHPDSLVINLVMVNVVPAFSPLSENTSAGYARVRGNGIIGFVGDNLLTFQNGRDVIAGVMAHEIAHNLGLNHTGSNQPNLMSPSGTSEQLDSSQISLARSSSFARIFSAPLPGDFNNDGRVDSADYVAWRKTDGTTTSYNSWRQNFSDPNGSGSWAPSAVPEPNAIVLVFAALAFVRRRRRTLFVASRFLAF